MCPVIIRDYDNDGNVNTWRHHGGQRWITIDPKNKEIQFFSPNGVSRAGEDRASFESFMEFGALNDEVRKVFSDLLLTEIRGVVSEYS